MIALIVSPSKKPFKISELFSYCTVEHVAFITEMVNKIVKSRF